MTPDAAYQARPIKRSRATKAEVEARREALFHTIADCKPATVRQVFYQATVQGLVEKTERGYAKVQTDLTVMRRAGQLPYSWLTDHTRWRRQPDSFGGPEEALELTARTYRKALWREADTYAEVWLEKEALAGVLFPITALYDAPLMVARGYASLSFLHSAAEAIAQLDRPAFIYHFGDHDPSGVNAAATIESRLREMAPHAEIVFERVAVTEEQIVEWRLPTRPTKASDSRAGKFGSQSVELDAIDPETLRALCRACLEDHLPQHTLDTMKRIEEAERERLLDFAAQLRGTGGAR